MFESKSFYLGHHVNKYEFLDVEKLNEDLASLGVNFSIEKNQNEKTGEEYFHLVIKYDTGEIYKKRTRYAGRVREIIRIKDPSYLGGEIKKSIKFSDVNKMLETMSDEEVYKKLGISRATYYRRKKRMMEELDRYPTDDFYF